MNKNTILIRFIFLFLILGTVILISYEMTHVYGAAKITKQDLPKIGTEIHAGIDHLELKKIKFRQLLKLDGWAYLNKNDAESQIAYIVLYSQHKQYVFNSERVIRNDLPTALNNDKDNVQNAGLTSLIDMTKVESGSYQIGFYIVNNNASAFTLSNMTVNKSDSVIDIKENINSKQNIEIKKTLGKVQANLEEISNNNGIIKLKGWIFIEGVTSDKTKIYIVLKNKEKIVVYDTQTQFRKDVTNYFGGTQDYDKSGFTSNISQDDLGEGIYQVGLYVDNGESSGLYWSEESIGEK
ncbi:hypothetical protein D3C74_111520 [compost metagenome]